MTWTVSAATSGASGDRHHAPQQDHRTQDRVTGDELDALADVRDEAGLAPLWRRAQVAAHEREGQARERERRRVDGERQARPDGRRQEPGDGRTDDEAERVDRLEDRVRPGELRAADEDRHRCRVPGEEERAEDAHRGGDDQDDRQRRPAEDDRERDEGRQPGTAEIGQEHHPLPVAAVSQGAGNHPEQEVGQRRQRADDAHPQPRAGQCQDEQRERREADRVAERRDALRRQQDPEVVVPTEGRWFGHQRMVRAATATPTALRSRRGRTTGDGRDRRGRAAPGRPWPDLRERREPVDPTGRRAPGHHPAGATQGRADRGRHPDRRASRGCGRAPSGASLTLLGPGHPPRRPGGSTGRPARSPTPTSRRRWR